MTTRPRTIADRLCTVIRRAHSRIRPKLTPNSWTSSAEPMAFLLTRLQSQLDTTAERIRARMLEPHGVSLSANHARDVVCALVELHRDLLGKMISGPIEQVELFAAVDKLFAAHPGLFRSFNDTMRADLARLQADHSRTDPSEALRIASSMQPDRLRRQLYCRREATAPEDNDA